MKLTKVIKDWFSKHISSSHLTSYPSALLKLLFERGSWLAASISNTGSTFNGTKWVEFKTKNAKPLFYVRFSLSLLVLLVVLASIFTHFNLNVVEGATLWTSLWSLHSHFVEGLRNIANGMFALTLTAYYRHCLPFMKKALNGAFIDPLFSGTICGGFLDTYSTQIRGNVAKPTTKATTNTIINWACGDVSKSLVNTLDLKKAVDVASYFGVGAIFTYNPRTGRVEFIQGTALTANYPYFASSNIQPLLFFNKYGLSSSVSKSLLALKHQQLVVGSLNNFSRGGFGLQSALTPLLNVNNVAGQVRWSVKNSPSGGDPSRYNQFLVDSKKLLNVSMCNADLVNSNVWVANFYEEDKAKSVLNRISGLVNVINYNPDEISKGFFSKRSLLTINQKLILNTTSIKVSSQYTTSLSSLTLRHYNNPTTLNEPVLDDNTIKTSFKPIVGVITSGYTLAPSPVRVLGSTVNLTYPKLQYTGNLVGNIVYCNRSTWLSYGSETPQFNRTLVKKKGYYPATRRYY